MSKDKVFVWLPGGGKARIITDADNIEGERLKLGTDYVSEPLGKGTVPDPDGVRRIPVKKVKKIT